MKYDKGGKGDQEPLPMGRQICGCHLSLIGNCQQGPDVISRLPSSYPLRNKIGLWQGSQMT